MEELTTVILSGIAWDAIKKGINISVNYLKNKLSNWIIDNNKLEEICECVQNIPEAYRLSEGMIREYLNMNEKLLDILEGVKQEKSHISQNITTNEGIAVTKAKNINFYLGKNSSENSEKLEIEKQNLKINIEKLKILEAEHNPYFSLECKSIWEKVEETKGTDKIAKNKYVLTNNGGNIRNVSYFAESYIIFYVPTSVENEWYIFNYKTNDFDINHMSLQRQEENDKKFVFYEYTSKKDKNENDHRAFKLGKYLSENLNIGITHSFKNVLHITYIDYRGDKKYKIFEFFGSELNELDKNIDGFCVGTCLDGIKRNRKGEIIRMPVDINDINAVGKAIKEDIENWMEKNKGKKGYKKKSRVWYNYDIID